MIFMTLPPDAVRKILEGHQDVLTPAQKEHEVFFRHLSCPSCGGGVMPIVHPVMNRETGQRSPFRAGDVLPNYLAKCKVCEVEFEPYTGIQVTAPA
jgi:hypothetical protein